MRTAATYFDTLTGEKLKIALVIRKLILSQVPGIEERLSFNIPFYHYYGMFMYLNSVAAGIDVGFCRGKDLLECFPQLECRGRAIVASVVIENTRAVTEKNLSEIILAAAAWNKEAKEKKIRMVAPAKKKSLSSQKGTRKKRS